MTTPAPCPGDPVTEALRQLKLCVAAQLGACGRPVCRFPLVANGGHPPADACHCECPDDPGGAGNGQAWVRMATLNRGAGTTNLAGCFNGLYDVTLETGLYRCYPVPTGNQATLDEDEETAAAEGMYLDAAILRRAVLCCAWFTDHDMYPLIQHESFIGPSGGCIGVELQFVVKLGECPCPEQQEAP